jgi:two-component system, NarL family, response regulator NreC
MTTKIILADDHKIMRDGLRTLLEKELGMQVIGEAENGHKVVRLVHELLPDVVIIDIGMPDLNGIEATRQILAKNPNVKVIGLSMHSDKRFVAGMLSAGASGYLLKDCAFEELADAIHAVVKNKIYLSPGIVGVVIKDYVQHLSPNDLSAQTTLTDREREVLQLIAEGKSTKKIASILYVSMKTVETHRLNIMEKLNTKSIAELTKYAIREGLTSLDT